MNPVNFACLLALALASATLSAQTYQWRDADGVLHFSATPPPPGSSQGPVEAVDAAPPSRFRPEVRNGSVYCGTRRASSLRGPMDSWLVDLAGQLDQEQTRLLASSGGEDSDMSRCIINWIEGQLQDHQAELARLAEEYRTLLAEHQNLTGVKAHCPGGSGWLVGEEARDWYDCHVPTSRKLSATQRRLRYLSPLKPHFPAAGSR